MCPTCSHPSHIGSECEVITGYDHLNGDHDCGCPGPLCPECAQGKTINCCGEAYDPGTDLFVTCAGA